ncbi:hypothetical protein PMW_25 [Pseudomonas phage phiPMW]|uniref:Uncharacterized protein n=1 Tax=Pseudomonas phage phiPMW TaxID=1815582 RepID=A0A1S5R159_9CAUD|nr:hypothetical protein FDG97_gp025 [Pseudomonas phage phiPMW]ANA49150.1 hypothetical protein PMW_25 [Pseudomonas phage phiPMW]
MIEVKRGTIYKHRINGMQYKWDGASWEYKSKVDGQWWPSLSSNFRLIEKLEEIEIAPTRILTAHDFDYSLTLDRTEEGMFVVTYGEQVTAWQKWQDAFNDFTECVAHASDLKGLHYIH